MSSIFIGMLLVFLDFNLDIGASRIGLIPDFIGYIFMIRGLLELAELSGKFVKAIPYAKGMVIYSGICYGMDLFGITALIGQPAGFILGLISTIVSLYISYNIIKGVEDIELSRSVNLNSFQLYSAWKLLAVISLIVYVVFFIPAIGLICILAGLISGIYYMYIFNKTKKLFYEQNPTA